MKRTYRLEMETRELAAAEALGRDRVPPTPRLAAGVILARDGSAGPEVLLVRRRPDVGFAAGAYVFPGGTLDAEDSDPEWEQWLNEPEDSEVTNDDDPGDARARRFLVAALRELFEETGVLLLAEERPPQGELSAERGALVEGRRSFLNIVGDNDIRLASDRLVLCARWITPESLSRRYDARFFLAEAPRDVAVVPEAGELAGHIWIRPAEALERYFDGGMDMLFPTVKTLEWLEEGQRIADWRERFRATDVVPILPRLRRVDGAITSVMPGEPGYDDREGDG